MITLSLVVPTYTVNQNLLDMTLVCVNSFRPYVDELIICEDTNSFIKELHEVCDVYITHPNLQLARNANMGWGAASCAYISEASADTTLYAGDPKLLCVPEKFNMPQVLRRNVTETCCYFVLSRDMYNQYGMWNPVLKWKDTDTHLFNKYRPFMNLDPRVIIETEMASPGSFQRAHGPE